MATVLDAKSNEYILERDWRAMARLNQRHFLFKLTQGYLLHPSIQLKEDSKVADIGAGTCVWSIALLRELPFFGSVDAIDISSAQFPAKDWLPTNVNAIVHDAYQPFPAQMLGVYDLVHIRNWLCIWRNETSKTLITNLAALLKPGGYIQWSEQDPTANRVIGIPDSTSSTNATQELLDFLINPRENIAFNWVSELGSLLSHHLALIAFDRHIIRKEHQSFWDISVLQTCEEFSANLRSNAKCDDETEKASRLQDAVNRASFELSAGAGIHQELIVAVAQK